MTLRIYGAGMAGLLAANMLRRHRPLVYERQTELPDNHGALLRFRTEMVSRETGIPFRKVNVLKAVWRSSALWTQSTLQDANSYAYKVLGQVHPRSVLDLAPVERFIAPDVFCATMARDVPIHLGMPVEIADLADFAGQSEDAAISTIPMPTLMKIVGWPSPPEFVYRPIWSVTVLLNDANRRPGLDVHQTIYYPEAALRYYRASITGNTLTVEFSEDPTKYDGCIEESVAFVRRHFGVPESFQATMLGLKRQEYGKLLPISETARQEFILAMTDQFNLYSLGRFGTWRQILLDDVVKDVRVIERMITQRSGYARRLKSVGLG